MTIVGQVPSVGLDAQQVEPGTTPAPRQCGRCRKLFDGDPTLHAAAIADWWLCASCRVSLRIDAGRGTP